MSKISKFLLVFFSCFLLTNSFAEEIDNTQDLKDYIKQLMTDSMGMLENQHMSIEEKVAKAKTSLTDNIDFDSMSKQSLGRANYNKINDKEFVDYKEVYKNYLVNAYSRNVNDYNGQIMNIKSVSKVGLDQYLVRTEIVNQKNNISVSIDFYVRAIQGVNNTETFKILDIVTEGISLIQTQQNEFNSIIESSNMDGLIRMLKEKS
jgi:phospholipid transport system substrate-binding protein